MGIIFPLFLNSIIYHNIYGFENNPLSDWYQMTMICDVFIMIYLLFMLVGVIVNYWNTPLIKKEKTC